MSSDQDRVNLAAKMNRAVDLWASAGETYPYAESYEQFFDALTYALAYLGGDLGSRRHRQLTPPLTSASPQTPSASPDSLHKLETTHAPAEH